MKYPCGLIQDVLPLYLDGICGNDTVKAVKTHLEECSECQQYFEKMKTLSSDSISNTEEKERFENGKAEAFKKMKRKLFTRQLCVAVFCVLIVFAVFMSAVFIMKNTRNYVEYNSNISVVMREGDLIGRLEGSSYTNFSISSISLAEEASGDRILFVSIENSKWNELTTSSKVLSEFVVCPADKDATGIRAVYYYTGDITDFSSLSRDELNEVIAKSVLLWEKQ